MGSKQHLIWLDLEMTGLDPETERIIEIATVVTDTDLNVVANGPNLVISQPTKLLDAMDDWNQKQHRRSGLLPLVQESILNEGEAERQTLRFLETYLKPGESPLCGNSIGHDRRFLARYMPTLEGFLHYRNLDVSSLKMLAQYWKPNLKRFSKKSSSHRALEDVNDSIDELKYYRAHLIHCTG